MTIVRPLLDIPKARLIATLRKARIAFADDPSNRDPRFTRVRAARQIMPAPGEGRVVGASASRCSPGASVARTARSPPP